MTLADASAPPGDAVRAALQRLYGLALAKLSADQIERAILLASRRSREPVMSPPWLQAVIDELPIDESWLFRDSSLWSFVQRFLARRLSDGLLLGGLHAVSLGCSAGQEVFSLAMLMACAGVQPGSGSYVLGIDSSPERVAVAKSGRLSSWSVSRSSTAWREVASAYVAAHEDGWQLDASVRALCRFEVGNLLEWAVRPTALASFHLVFCRHVLIYFDKEDAQSLVCHLAASLSAGSVLVLAPSETHLLRRAALEPCGHPSAGRKGEARTARPKPRGERAKAETRTMTVATRAALPASAGSPAVMASKSSPAVAAPSTLVTPVAPAPVVSLNGTAAAAPFGSVVSQWLHVRECARDHPDEARRRAREILAQLRNAPPQARVGEEGELSVEQVLQVLLPLLAELEGT